MMLTRVAFVGLLGGLALFAACGDTESADPQPGSDAGLALDATPGLDATTTDSASADVTTADVTTVTDAAADAPSETAAPCPIGIDDTVTATIGITVDNNRKLYVNGVLIDGNPYEWSSPTTHTISLFRHPSRKNVIAVEAYNASSQGGLDRGILADISFDPTHIVSGADAGDGGDAGDAGDASLQDGGIVHVLTDSAWKVSSTLDTDWFGLTFVEPGGYAAAVEQGANGVSPWGNIGVVGAQAKWIWTYDSSTGSKPNTETVYARRTFYFDVSGNVTAAPSACP